MGRNETFGGRCENCTILSYMSIHVWELLTCRGAFTLERGKRPLNKTLPYSGFILWGKYFCEICEGPVFRKIFFLGHGTRRVLQIKKKAGIIMSILAYFSWAGGFPDPQGPLSDKMSSSTCTIVAANKAVSAKTQY